MLSKATALCLIFLAACDDGSCPARAPLSGAPCADVPKLCSYTAPDGRTEEQCACESSGSWSCGQLQADFAVPITGHDLGPD